MNPNGSYEELFTKKGDSKPDGEEKPWGFILRGPQPELMVVDSEGRHWSIPYTWSDHTREEDGSLVRLFANGLKMTLEGAGLFEPLHTSVFSYLARHTLSILRVDKQAVTRIVVEPQEEEKRK